MQRVKAISKFYQNLWGHNFFCDWGYILSSNFCLEKGRNCVWKRVGVPGSYWTVPTHFDIERPTSHTRTSCTDPEGDRGSGPPENHKNVEVPSNIFRIPLKWQSYQASIRFWVIIGTPTKLHLNGVSLTDRRRPAYRGGWIPIPS